MNHVHRFINRIFTEFKRNSFNANNELNVNSNNNNITNRLNKGEKQIDAATKMMH